MRHDKKYKMNVAYGLCCFTFERASCAKRGQPRQSALKR